MRCHYEVLSVERDADADALKKAYRKLALNWHPDKNRDNIDEAEEKFKEIVAAYEVLNDPQERSWYDSHRESILRGGDGTAQSDETISIVPDLWKWFRPSCYQGFGDDDEGFYTVYRNVFDEVKRIDVENEFSKTSNDGLPSFGDSTSSHDEVLLFYGMWEGFFSKLNFGWLDKYNPNDYDYTRDQRRMIERENKKARDVGKREYNELVRNLVGFVKKRDKRMVDIALKRQEKNDAMAAKRQQMLEEKKLKKKAAREAWFESHQEEIRRQEEQERETGEKIFRLADEHEARGGNENTVWECEVCSKKFKSKKQFHNHEKSKKHKEALKQFEKLLREEEAMALKLQMEQDELILQELEAAELASEDGELDHERVETCTHEKSETIATGKDGESDNESGSSDDESSSDGDFGAFGKLRVESDDSSDDEDNGAEYSTDNPTVGETSNLEGSQSSVEETSNISEERQVPDQTITSSGETVVADDTTVSSDEVQKSTPGNSKSKAQRKPQLVQPVTEKTDYFCATCSSYFATRNQLFKHIKQTNHAVAPDKIPKQKKTKKANARKNKR
eukprot:CAMPEP_0203751714 /NCGR_PEP_ID=MMETSP0098-20131031/5747_1 /ASSEMBLY_ACC=CAM_ASM_000208 /TAXON_ID=96639 /ORGANISM=" , Strain NY0313808BC1" /LENGTH=562 /DNA_ID=CAMNT_0050641571 /DNA_START=530 /DNA_END=2218 /DNA_ORIENTATION=-